MERWEKLGSQEISRFIGEDGALNEFEMMWELRKSFPLHYILFKQLASHLPHEGNSENTFSRAGSLSDPNINPVYMSRLTKIGINRKVYDPPLERIKERYYQKFSNAGKCIEDMDQGLGLVVDN